MTRIEYVNGDTFDSAFLKPKEHDSNALRRVLELAEAVLEWEERFRDARERGERIP